ncbi:MAG: hypothetical protein ACLFVP_05860 [Candidatus Bathyarchaeia archaeon]
MIGSILIVHILIAIFAVELFVIPLPMLMGLLFLACIIFEKIIVKAFSPLIRKYRIHNNY